MKTSSEIVPNQIIEVQGVKLKSVEGEYSTCRGCFLEEYPFSDCIGLNCGIRAGDTYNLQFIKTDKQNEGYN